MNISVDDLGQCKKLIRIEFEEAAVKEASDAVISKYQGQVQMPGFRKGKAPRLMIISNYREDIEQQVKSDLMDKGLKKALKDNDFRFVSYNDLEVISFDLNGNFSFTANIEIEPNFELPEYKGLDVEVVKINVADEDVEEAIEALRAQLAEYVDCDGPLTSDLMAVIDYKGSIDGVPVAEKFQDAKSISERTGQWLKLDTEGFLPGFNDNLIGKNKGDTVNFDSTFPEDFAYKDLAGKTVQFEVSVTDIKKSNLPELNDEFAASLDAETMDDLRKGVREDLELEADNRYKKELRSVLVQKLDEAVDFEVPQSMADETTKRMVYDIVYQNQQAGVSKEQIEESTDEIYSNASHSAVSRVKHTLLLLAIARKEDIKVSQEELSGYIGHMASSYNIKPEKLVKDLKEKNGFQEIMNNITLAKTIDLIQLNANITDIPKTKADLLKESEKPS